MISEHQGQFSHPVAGAEGGIPETTLATLARYLAGNETRLVEILLAYCMTRSYNAHVSTLPEAWLASVQGLNRAIALMLETRGDAEIDYDADIGADPSTAYGIEVASRHGLRGVPLGMFLSNFKAYRQSYLQLLAEAGFAAQTEALYRRLVRGFFDRAEIGICTQWGKGVVDADYERLLAENQRVVTEKNKYLTIFESIQTPVFLVDAEGGIENMNHAAARLLSRDVLPGSVYYGSAARRSFKGLFGLDPRAIAPATPDCPAPEHRIDTLDGPRWVSVSTQEMLDVSRKFLGTVVSFTDVTDARRAREEAEALAQAKTDFLATMSHEIRTPIHSIGGIVEVLRQDDLSPRAAGYVDAIDRSARVLSSIVSEILDYSRIEAGGLTLERVDFPLAEILADVGRVMAPLVARKPGLMLHLEAPPDLPCVSGDPAKLRQILLNLAGNAVKFTPRGAVVIRLDLAARGPGASGPGRVSARFSVRDTGPGIAPERLEDIFRPFTQSDSSIERKHGGTGLGLAISRRLAEVLGGALGVESRLGEGSCFRLEVPLDLAVRQGADCARARAEAAPPAKALRLLIVEDDAVNLLVTETLLRQAGHRVRLADSAEAALQALSGQHFDLVLTDLNLPDLSGFELARAIRAHADPAIAGLPIAALSAHGPAVDPAALAAVGIGGFLAKPFAFARLEDLLRRLSGFASPRPIGSGAPRTEGQGSGFVDPKVLRGHVEALGTGPTGRIVATFKASLGQTAAEFDAAARSGRWNEVAMVAHRLKSSARHVGLLALAEEAERVEMAASGSGRPSAELAGEVADLVLSCGAAVGLAEAIWAEVAG